MQLKDHLRKQSNWTITAMTAGAVTIVAATGIVLADDVRSRADLKDQVSLRDHSSSAQALSSQANIPPVLFAGDGGSFESPLDGTSPVAGPTSTGLTLPMSLPTASADSPAVPGATAEAPVMAASSGSFDSPDYVSAPPAPAYQAPAQAFADSFESPLYVAPPPPVNTPIPAPVQRAPIQSYDSPVSVQTASVASFESAASFDSPS